MTATKRNDSAEPLNQSPRGEPASVQLQSRLRQNRQSGKGGVYAVCSAHPNVIDAAICLCVEDGSVLHVESTSSQVNQFGGYSGLTPQQFADAVRSAARLAGLGEERVLLGGDHLGPYPWRNEASAAVLRNACALVRDYVAAGYQKIHLDTSMACADDPNAMVPEDIVASRAATLCQAAEEAHRGLPPESPPIVYVIGTEVPAPGGEWGNAKSPAVTKPEHADRTLETFFHAFAARGLDSAWERVIALVVQPGVGFSANVVFNYDRASAASLSASLAQHPGIVFEAHSTDYQTPRALAQMVEDHFAILKVGPLLTFAYREALLALSAIERELLSAKRGRRVSQVREALEGEMLGDPAQWRSYYHGDEEQIRRNLIFGYSDRCRYYWNRPAVQKEVGRLLDNLADQAISLALISQYLQPEYEAIRSNRLPASPKGIIQHRIQRVLRTYARACR